MFRSLFEFSVEVGYKLLPIGVTGAVLSLLLAFINDMGYFAIVLVKEEDTFIGKLSKNISKFMWGALAPFILIAVLGMTCYICKLLINMGVM